jgi:ferredoxin--NADP+ reductase
MRFHIAPVTTRRGERMVGTQPPQRLLGELTVRSAPASPETEPSAPGARADARPTVAIVGSGPSGCYVAQFLSKEWPDAQIVVFESLPVPYGLIRYGVAADHQGAKGVTRQFDRMFTRDGVRFAGNVTVGRDIGFARLAECFDVVVLATGLSADRTLDVPCDPAARVVGAGALLRALNGFPGHPPHSGLPGGRAPLGSRLLVVGLGNVAVDVLRLMSKDAEHLTGSDIDDEMLARLRPRRPQTIDVLVRSGATQAKCDASMLRELLALPTVRADVLGLDDHDEGPVAELLRRNAPPPAGDAPADEADRTRLTFHFGAAPEAVTTRGGRTVLTARHRRAQGGTTEFAVDTVVTAIGFTHGSMLDRGTPQQHWAGDHVYRVGWLSRGAQGTIPHNRKDARLVARSIVDDFERGLIQARRPGFAALEPAVGHRVVGFREWQRIEAQERRSARPGRCRRKITDLAQMLAVASGTTTPRAGRPVPPSTSRPAADAPRPEDRAGTRPPLL